MVWSKGFVVEMTLADAVALVYKFRHSNDTNFLTVHKYDVGVQ